MRRGSTGACMVLGMLLCLGALGAPQAAAEVRVCILPLGPHDKRLLGVVKAGVEHLYGFEVRVLAPRKLPKAAYYPPRKRYRAEKLLRYIDAEVIPGSGCSPVVGFTKVDISTTKGRYEDWGVFGLGTVVGGNSAVVSTYRLRPKGKGRGARRKLAKRTVKVVNHEIGHTLGLYHHPGEGCLMEDARGTIKTVDRETGLLCESSRRALNRYRGVKVPERARFDWEAVLGD